MMPCPYRNVHPVVTLEATATEMIADLFADSNFVTFSNAKLTGNPICAGLFSGGNSAVPSDFPDTGVVISTGHPASLHLQSTDRESNMNGAAGDADLDAIVAGDTTDACVLEFDFECTQDPCAIEFQYVFGSEEYNEFAESPFNDVFAWFLNGQNIALIPGSNEEVSINTVNENQNSNLFRNNDPSDTNVPYPNMEADGFTTTLKAAGNAVQGTNTMKLVIADRSDQMFDSWALFKTGSFVYVPPMGGGGGDPHFMRWGQQQRNTFHGECDLVIMKADNFHGKKGLDFHVRTTMHEHLYSYIEASAVRIGEDVVEIHNGNILLNNIEYSDADLPIHFGEDKSYEIYLANIEYKNNGRTVRRRWYRIKLDDHSEIEFKFYSRFMTFEVLGHEDFSEALGMLGAYPSGAMLSRSGQEMKNFIDFGFEWQVGLSDPTLFSALREPQLPYERCRLPSKSVQAASRRFLRGNTQLFEAAKQACAAMTKGSDLELCVDDVMMTSDLEMAKEW